MKRAFSLLELLIVVVIISLMAAMIFPVFAQARTAAKRTVSLQNVKQVTIAQFLYKDDFDDSIAMNRDCSLVMRGHTGMVAPCIPGRGARGWIDLVVPYVKNYAIFKSPQDFKQPVPLPIGARHATGERLQNGYIWGDRNGVSGNVLGGDYRSSYARNNNFSNNGTYTATFSQPNYPSTLVLIYSFAPNTGGGANGNEGTPGSSFSIIRRQGVQPEPGSCAPYSNSSTGNWQSNFLYSLSQWAQDDQAVLPSSERYGGSAIYGFADGHAKVLRPSRIKGQCQWGAEVEFGNDGSNPDFRF